MTNQKYEQEIFEKAIRHAYCEARDSNRKRLNTALQKALPLINHIKDAEFDYIHLQILYIGKRSYIAYDGHLYALLHGLDLRVIYKSFCLNDVWPDFIKVENNED